MFNPPSARDATVVKIIAASSNAGLRVPQGFAVGRFRAAAFSLEDVS
jgi:hypothetical protein